MCSPNQGKAVERVGISKGTSFICSLRVRGSNLDLSPGSYWSCFPALKTLHPNVKEDFFFFFFLTMKSFSGQENCFLSRPDTGFLHSLQQIV